MPQILHIFRKDGRRHWPEILASLLLLGLYVHLNLRPWENPSYSFFSGTSCLYAARSRRF
jgi:hypothetical protein